MSAMEASKRFNFKTYFDVFGTAPQITATSILDVNFLVYKDLFV